LQDVATDELATGVEQINIAAKDDIFDKV